MKGANTMELHEIISRSAPLPIWINEDGEATRYEKPGQIPTEYHSAEVTYITVDGNGEMTVEIAR